MHRAFVAAVPREKLKWIPQLLTVHFWGGATRKKNFIAPLVIFAGTQLLFSDRRPRVEITQMFPSSLRSHPKMAHCTKRSSGIRRSYVAENDTLNGLIKKSQKYIERGLEMFIDAATFHQSASKKKQKRKRDKGNIFPIHSQAEWGMVQIIYEFSNASPSFSRINNRFQSPNLQVGAPRTEK